VETARDCPLPFHHERKEGKNVPGDRLTSPKAAKEKNEAATDEARDRTLPVGMQHGRLSTCAHLPQNGNSAMSV
jgi:hypothetical protein